MGNTKEYGRAYREKNKERISANKKRWRKEHPEKQREYERRRDPIKKRAFNERWKLEHKDELIDYRKRYYLEHRTEHRQRHTRVKVDVVSRYSGGRCVCNKCGFSDIRALSIDHINNDGGCHRRELGKKGGSGFYRWLRDNNYPSGYEVLCFNCQMIKLSEFRDWAFSVGQLQYYGVKTR